MDGRIGRMYKMHMGIKRPRQRNNDMAVSMNNLFFQAFVVVTNTFFYPAIIMYSWHLCEMDLAMPTSNLGTMESMQG